MTTWDVRGADGAIVSDLAGLAGALRTTPATAALHLVGSPTLSAAAPEALLAEAKAAAKPGGGTPPPIDTGSFVSFPGGKGRVDLVVKKGTVPGVDSDVEATSDSPAARVVVWKDGKATREKRAYSTHKLKRIAPLDGPGKKDAVSGLVALHNFHVAQASAFNLPEFRRLGAEQIKTAYDRGLEAWPGESVTSLSREEWALGRAEHLVKVAGGEVARKDAAGNDRDLLDPAHPLAVEPGVAVPVDEVDMLVKALMSEGEIEGE
jgi:hypothetical protein